MDADLILKNGEVITVDENFSICEALAVKDNKIIAVGTNRDILTLQGNHTQVIDLKGKSLIPGFIDSHAHLELYGTNKLGENCKDVDSIEDIQHRLRETAENTLEGEWIRGWGYNQNTLSEGRHPNRWDLDKVSTDHPIIIVRTCGHISCVNSKALELAGIDEKTPNPAGGKYVRDDNLPTGVLLESAHMNMFMNAMYSEEEILNGLELASADYASKGITSVHDAGGYNNDHFRYLQKAVHDGKIKQRVYALIGSLHDSPGVLNKALDAGMVTGLGDEWFKIGPAKVFIDGSSSGPTARTRAPYTSNPNDNGILYLNEVELNKLLGKAHDLGWQLTAHAIGDQAVEMMVNCIEQALDKKGRSNHRHRIEHAGMTPPDLAKKMNALNIVPIPNPAFIREFGDGYINDYGERVETMFPIRQLIDEGLTAAIGSDSPITTFNPLIGIQAAVTRESKAGTAVGDSRGSAALYSKWSLCKF